MKKLIYLLAPFFLILLSFSKSYSQTDHRVQSVFLYNFTRLVAWPTDYQTGDFVVGVLGDSPMVKEVEDMAATKRAGNQPILARKFNSPNDITRCHILYIPAGQSRRIEEAISALQNQNIKALVVTDTRNGTRNGATVNFVVLDGRQRFEISQANARNMGLTLGGEMSRLGIAVD